MKLLVVGVLAAAACSQKGTIWVEQSATVMYDCVTVTSTDDPSVVNIFSFKSSGEGGSEDFTFDTTLGTTSCDITTGSDGTITSGTCSTPHGELTVGSGTSVDQGDHLDITFTAMSSGSTTSSCTADFTLSFVQG